MRPATGCSRDSIAATGRGAIAERVQRAGDGQQVVDVEAAEQRRVHRDALAADDQVEAAGPAASSATLLGAQHVAPARRASSGRSRARRRGSAPRSARP